MGTIRVLVNEVAESGLKSLALVFISSILTLVFYRIYLHPLRRVPGPFAAKYTELWRTRKYMLGDWHRDILDLHKAYGPVVRISPNEVSIVDKVALTLLFGHGKGTRKTAWYDVWKIPGFTNSFFNSTDPAEHSFLRKRVSIIFSLSSVLTHESEILELSNEVWSHLDESVKRNQPVALHDWASFFAFDVVTKLATGKEVGFAHEGKDIMGIIQSICDGFWQMANAGYLPGQMLCFRNPVSQLIWKIVTGKPAAYSGFQKWLMSAMNNRMKEVPDTATKRGRDMLDHFFAMKEIDGSKVGLPSVLAEVGNLVGAGADTTSVGIRSVLAQLISHPADYHHVQTEIDEAGSRNNGRLSYNILDKLPFLNACIKEALRMHPSILWQLPREAPAVGLEVAGYFIAPSATISMSPIAHNRDTSIFGEDADQWNPHRWLPAETNTGYDVKEMDKYNVTFGFGSRTCVGRNLALVEINNFVAEFCRRYDAEFCNKQRPFKVVSQWFSYQDDMWVFLKARNIAA